MPLLVLQNTQSQANFILLLCNINSCQQSCTDDSFSYLWWKWGYKTIIRMAVLVDWSWTICLYFNRWCSDYFLDWLTDLSEGKIWARPLHHLDTNTLWQIFHGNWHDPCFPRLYYPGSHLNLFAFKIWHGLSTKVFNLPILYSCIVSISL